MIGLRSLGNGGKGIADLRFGFLDCDGSGDLGKLVELRKGGVA